MNHSLNVVFAGYFSFPGAIQPTVLLPPDRRQRMTLISC